MGKNTKNFRQTSSSRSGSQNAQAYATIARSGNWFKRVTDFVKVRGKKQPGS